MKLYLITLIFTIDKYKIETEELTVLSESKHTITYSRQHEDVIYRKRINKKELNEPKFNEHLVPAFRRVHIKCFTTEDKIGRRIKEMMLLLTGQWAERVSTFNMLQNKYIGGPEFDSKSAAAIAYTRGKSKDDDNKSSIEEPSEGCSGYC